MTCKQCKNYDECQFDAACNDAVFDPDCSAKHCTGFELMTNGDRIRAMTDEQLAELLEQTAYAGATPWCEPFARKFCDNCPTVEATIKETGQTMELNECDFADGKCPHGSDIVWWLGQPAEVE